MSATIEALLVQAQHENGPAHTHYLIGLVTGVIMHSTLLHRDVSAAVVLASQLNRLMDAGDVCGAIDLALAHLEALDPENVQ